MENIENKLRIVNLLELRGAVGVVWAAVGGLAPRPAARPRHLAVEHLHLVPELRPQERCVDVGDTDV